jgi:glycogen debranching enzyme
LLDFNFLLNHCDPEEWVEMGNGTYEIGNFGKLPYCGFQGVEPLLRRIRGQNDLGHPLCTNIRQGLWLKGGKI